MSATTMSNTSPATEPSNGLWRGLALNIDKIRQLGGGRNQGTSTLINATNDLEAVQAFLFSKSSSSKTLRRYLLETQRLLLWASEIQHKSLSAMTAEDITAYLRFSASPPETWCGNGRPASDAAWRPYRSRQDESSDKPRLSEATLSNMLNVLSSLFSFLVNAGYLRGNPVKLVPRRRILEELLGGRLSPNQGFKKLWSDAQWGYVKAALNDWPKKTEFQQASFERMLFWMTCIFEAALRIGDMEMGLHGHFQRDHTYGKWVLLLRGKGDVQASQPVTSRLIEALQRYRRFHGLSDLPAPDDDIALLAPVKPIEADGRSKRHVSQQEARRSLKKLLQLATDKARADDHPEAEGILNGSLHSIRHQRAQRLLASGSGLRDVQQALRHKLLQTTTIYTQLDAEQQRDTLENPEAGF